MALQQRWVIFQHGGTHMHNSLEAALHLASKPCLWGNHQLDDPDVAALHAEQRQRAALSPEEAASRAWPTIERLGDRLPDHRVTQRTIIERPAPPATGEPGIVGWCYCNVPQDQRPEDVPPHRGFVEVCGEILAADPTVRLAVWVQHPPPALVELVAWLKDHHRDRHVTIMQKRGNTAQREFEGRYHAVEIALWQAADLHYMSRAGLIAKGAGRLWRDLHFDPRTVPLIHSGLSVADAEAILAKAESFLAEPSL